MERKLTLRLYNNQKVVLSTRRTLRYAGCWEEAEGRWVHTCYDVETDQYVEFLQLEVVDERKRTYRVEHRGESNEG